MSRSSIDHEALFEQVTGRQIRKEDAAELRRLRAHMPNALADSPSYNFSLVVTYYQMQQLRSVVASASEAIIDDVEHESEAAVDRLVENAVRRIHATSPSSTDAFYRAVVSISLLAGICAFLATLAIYGAISQGWLSPPWLTEESTYKVQWADDVEHRIGPGSIDWTMREGHPDKSLIDILEYVENRGTPEDPVRQLADHKRCGASGQFAYRTRGKSMCRFQVTEQ